MKIDVFDVGHGACSAITLPTGKRIIIDCGTRSSPHWWPSIHYYGQRIEALILTNLDEDHVHDFRSVLEHLRVGTVWINPTINSQNLLIMKPDGMQDGVRAVYDYLWQPTAINLSFYFDSSRVTSFFNRYGYFTDTNNLSLATFVEYGQFCILYPGDLETAGWKALLCNPNFRALLQRVSIFVTSHHGRENGCCDEVFSLCKPWAFIISDKEMVHSTQETNNWYRQRAIGLTKRITNFWDTPETRYVFTTRNDNCMSIDIDPTGNFILSTKSGRQDSPNYLFGLSPIGIGVL